MCARCKTGIDSSSKIDVGFSLSDMVSFPNDWFDII